LGRGGYMKQTINFRQISGLFILCAMLFFCFWRPYDPNSVYPEHSLEQPSAKHLFGTDRLGRDMYSRISSAVQSSVFRAGIAALASFFTAFVLAAVFALYLRKYKKIADLFRLVIRMLPPLLFLFGIVAWARENPFGEILSLFSLSFIFAWPVFSAELELTLKQPYIEGTKALGASSFYILKNVTTPNVLPNLIKYARLDFASLIAFEAFLGMGGLNKPPNPSLGALIFESRYAIMSSQAWLFIFPSMMLGSTLLIMYFIPKFIKIELNRR